MSVADQALRPLPGTATTLHRVQVCRIHIGNILSIGSPQAARRDACGEASPALVLMSVHFLAPVRRLVTLELTGGRGSG